MWRIARFCGLFLSIPCFAQVFQGELRLMVVDTAGFPIEASVALVSQASKTRQIASTDKDGQQIFRGLPFGAYLLEIHRDGFSPVFRIIEIESQLPRFEQTALRPEPVATRVDVTATLLGPNETVSHNYIGNEQLETRPISLPGRTVLDLVSQQPGWVQEGSGVIHPRGVDNGTQYLIDGFPITDIRSPAFAPELNINSFASVNVLTAGFPAEYGRRLGGLIEMDTKRNLPSGWHGQLQAEGGSFGTGNGYAALNYAHGRTAFGLSGRYGVTDRYLDPPVEPNYTNHGAEAGETAQFERDFTDRDRVRLSFSRSRTQFLVPNELLQEQAGQRQDRQATESLGQVSYQRIVSPNFLADIRAMVRDLSQGLQSNPLSTPVFANQDRGFRETYVKGALTAHYGRHELKTGGDAVFSSVRERFGYAITDSDYFDPEIPRSFQFSDRHQGREQSFFAQDLYRRKNLTVSVGLRFDHYSLLVDEQAWSPRASLSWYWAAAKVILHGSYDRIFQPPPVQNLLLSSSAAARSLAADTTGLAVPSARGNFWEGGISKNFARHLRLDANYFRRNLRNWSDDSFLLNTGVSFPTASDSAEIRGFETKVDVPAWGPFSGFISYTNQTGTGQLPLTGGLILDRSSGVLTSNDRFQLSTVQRNTIASSVRSRVFQRYWAGFRAWYGSGLPFELEGEPDPALLAAQYGERIVGRLNFERGRLRPSYAVDVSAGGIFPAGESKSVRLQGDIFNVTNRLNVLNFAGLFSGTAIAPPRSYQVRLSFEF